MKTRAERRHHHKRMIERVKTFDWLNPRYWYYRTEEELKKLEEDRQKQIRQMAENRHPCSCDACRNPRHSAYHKGKEKLTMQERRAFDMHKYEED